MCQDKVQHEISTARVNEELEALRQDRQGNDAATKSKARSNSFSVTAFSSRFHSGGGSSSVHADTTLITKFGASIREFSERRSSDYALSSRTSSAHGALGGGMWVRVTGSTTNDGNASTASSSAKSTARRLSASTPTEIAPLDLASLNAKLNMTLARTPSASSSSYSMRMMTPDATATQFQQNPSIGSSGGDGGNDNPGASHHRKSLKYAGKRVIMALRVKNRMPVDEKQEMIRLLLLKHMQRSNSKGVAAGDKKPGNALAQSKPVPPLEHKISGLTLSLPPDN